MKQSQQRVQESILEWDTIQATLVLKEAVIQSLKSSLTSANDLSSTLQGQVNTLKTELEETVSQLDTETAQTLVGFDFLTCFIATYFEQCCTFQGTKKETARGCE